MKRILIVAGGILGLVVAVLLIGMGIIRSWAGKLEDTDFLVQQIESAFNCRAEISEADLNLRPGISRLVVTGIGIGERDSFVEDGTLASERPPLQNLAFIDQIILELEGGALFRRELSIRDLSIERPQLDLTIEEDGSTSLDNLLREPIRKQGPILNAEATVEEPVASDGPSVEDTAKAVSKPFSVKDLPLSAIADRMEIEEMSIHATIQKTEYTVVLQEVLILLKDIDVKPTDLANHNSAALELYAEVSVDSMKHNMRFVQMVIDGEGSVIPFDPETGYFSPNLTASVAVLKDSFVDVLPLLDEVEDEVMKLEDLGVGLEGVRLRGDFSGDSEVSFTAHRGVVTTTSDFLIPIDENTIVIGEGSWVSAPENDHDFEVTFIASERLTTKALTEFRKFAEENVGETLAGVAEEAIIQPLVQEGFLLLTVQSSGDLGEPDVNIVTPVGDIASIMKGDSEETMDALKKEASKLLDSLLGD